MSREILKAALRRSKNANLASPKLVNDAPLKYRGQDSKNMKSLARLAPYGSADARARVRIGTKTCSSMFERAQMAVWLDSAQGTAEVTRLRCRSSCTMLKPLLIRAKAMFASACRNSMHAKSRHITNPTSDENVGLAMCFTRSPIALL